MYLSCPFFLFFFTKYNLTRSHTHTAADIQYIHPCTQTPALVACCVARRNERNWCRMSEGFFFFFPSSYLCWLQSRRTVPTCAPKWSMSTISRLCERLNLLRRISGISVTQCLLLLFLPSPVHPQACTLFTQRHGGWTPFTHREERKQRWDTGKKSSTGMQTRVSVWAPTAKEVRLFLELRRIHLMNLHCWNSFRVST